MTEAVKNDDSDHICELNLSVRIRSVCRKLGVDTISGLTQCTAKDLLECKNFGVTSLKEVQEKLAVLGLRLKDG